MTEAVIDGPVCRHDQRGPWVLGTAATAMGLGEAALLFIRRWLTAHTTMGVEADIRSDLHARLSFGAVFMLLAILQITVVTGCLLVMYWPLGLVVLGSLVPIVVTVLHYQGDLTRLSRRAQDQSGHIATHVEESALGREVVQALGGDDHVFEMSGGSGQRLCLARAIVAAPTVLVIDDALAGLAAGTESTVTAALGRALSDVTGHYRDAPAFHCAVRRPGRVARLEPLWCGNHHPCRHPRPTFRAGAPLSVSAHRRAG